jgi:hypothetical protein
VSPRARFFAATLLVSLSQSAWPQEAAAQRRAIRRGPAGPVVVVSPRFAYPPFYDPFFYRPFFGGFYSPYYFGWYGHYPPYQFPVYAYDRTGSARIQVTPRDAEVYVDGYFVGLVDSFDGYLQRLHVEGGEHELQFYLEGYRTIRQKVRFTPGTTLKIVHAMEPLAPGEANEPKPRPDPGSGAQDTPARRESRQYGRAQQMDFGTLSLQVQPGDAVVVIDGQEWVRPEGESRFVVDLAEGFHRVEVSKDGFRSYTRTIRIRRGQTLTLNVSLTSSSPLPPASRGVS